MGRSGFSRCRGLPPGAPGVPPPAPTGVAGLVGPAPVWAPREGGSEPCPEGLRLAVTPIQSGALSCPPAGGLATGVAGSARPRSASATRTPNPGCPAGPEGRGQPPDTAPGGPPCPLCRGPSSGCTLQAAGHSCLRHTASFRKLPGFPGEEVARKPGSGDAFLTQLTVSCQSTSCCLSPWSVPSASRSRLPAALTYMPLHAACPLVSYLWGFSRGRPAAGPPWGAPGRGAAGCSLEPCPPEGVFTPWELWPCKPGLCPRICRLPSAPASHWSGGALGLLALSTRGCPESASTCFSGQGCPGGRVWELPPGDLWARLTTKSIGRSGPSRGTPESNFWLPRG